MRAAVLTSASPDLRSRTCFTDIDVQLVPSRRTTQMRNVYSEGPRRQFVPQRASPLIVGPPAEEWKQTPIVLLGPVMGELEEPFAQALSPIAARHRRAGLAAPRRPRQPRATDHAGGLPRPPDAPSCPRSVPFGRGHPAGRSAPALTYWSDHVQIIAFTRGYNGADICVRGNWRHIDAFPAERRRPDGRGRRLRRGLPHPHLGKRRRLESDPLRHLRRVLLVEGEGINAVPTREQVEARLKEHPGIVAR